MKIDVILKALQDASIPPSVSHAVIRLQRAYASFATSLNAADASSTASTRSGLETEGVRLKSRMEELQERMGSFVESSAGTEEDKATLRRIAEDVRSAQAEVEALVAGNRSRDGASRQRALSQSVAEELRRKVRAGGPAGAHSGVAAESAGREQQPPRELDEWLSKLSVEPTPPLPTSTTTDHAKALSEAYQLHLLATRPKKVLPPGTTLASLFRQTAAQGSSLESSPSENGSLEARVTSIVQDTYFANHLAALSSPPSSTPQSSNDAWSIFKSDLWTAAAPLIPSRLDSGRTKPRLEAIFSPPTTTSANAADTSIIPNAINELHDLLLTLSKLCAPARDQQFVDLIASLSSPASPELLVTAVRSTLSLTEEMASDLKKFRKSVVGQFSSDEEVVEIVRGEAARREREAVLKLYGGSEGGGEDGVKRDTKRWVEKRVAEGEGGKGVSEALVETMFRDVAVGLPGLDGAGEGPLYASPTAEEDEATTNTLPPIFIIPSPTIFNLQLHLQALVILACLVSLLPTPSTPSTTPSPSPTWIERVWIILESSFTPSSSSSTSQPASSDDIRLINISDELVREAQHRSGGGGAVPPGEEERLRKGVDRILRYEDPVWKLLKGRLRKGVSQGLKKTSEGGKAEGGRGEVPEMRTGRGEVRKRNNGEKRKSLRLPAVMGYSHPFLIEKMEALVKEVSDVVGWADEVWGRVLAEGE
ncbi:hypothetical protein MNV49_004475 [Pseudohyphozyma bogoriensis]|nr:hypothetical protein MNV49_004475 [Pseudohyphozyma bogoriensis]